MADYTRRGTARESRVDSFESGTVKTFDPLRGQQFASLTDRGQLAYADFIKNDYHHDEAFRLARISYGTRRAT